MEKKDRLAKAIAYLKMQGLVDSQVDAARKMNAAESTMSSAIGGNERYLNNKFLKRFNNAFGNIFSFEWLASGIGEMFTNCGCSSADDASIYHPSQNGTCTDFATDLERNQSEAEAKDGRSMSAADLARDNARLRQELALKNKLIADQAVRLSRYEAKQ